MKLYNMNYKRMFSVALLLSSTTNFARCDAKDDDNWMNKFAKIGKDAMGNIDIKNGVPKDFSSMFNEDIINKASAKAHELMEGGLPVQVGYGFMMGYSSGYCLKKVSKIMAFALGGVFIVVQSLSYNGYMIVNYEKVQKDVEKVMDLNKDGKVDEKDAIVAYDKIHDVLSYNMPTGGGFSAGLLMGLRS